MLLRSVTEHVRSQNWTAIWIDFLIVVLGVFVGIQVSNWNQGRRDSDRARGYLERVSTDLASDVLSLQRRREFWRDVIEHGHGAIRFAETGELVRGSAWKTVLAFYQASQIFPYVPVDTTYLEMRSAGEVSLIKDQGLRAALAQYYVTGTGLHADYLFRLVPEYRKLVRGLTPSIVSSHVWANCHAEAKMDEQRLIDCESPMPEADARAVLDVYLADPHLLAELRFWITNLEVAERLINVNETAARDLAARLRGASGS
jgi:hypothetical protein